jgi:hypothetical protein
VCPNPNAQVTPFTESDTVVISLRSGTKPFETEASTANKFLKSLSTRSPPAVVFCSRELEHALAEFVTAEVTSASLGLTTVPFPSDDTLRAKAREILGVQNTAADDPVLLEKFKSMMQEKLGLKQTGTGTTPVVAETQQPDVLPLDMEVTLTDGELTDILQDMNFDFGDDSQQADPILGGRNAVM